MSWDALDNDELRNLPTRLVATRRWNDLRDAVFDAGYLRAVMSRLGAADLTQILGAVVDSPEVATPLRARCADLRDLIVEEAGFLSAPQYAGLAGPFRNHLDLAWVRRGRSAGQSPTSGDRADLGAEVGQEGWLDLVARTGPAMRRATPFFMPGRRENFVSDIRYNSGPAGVATFVAVDLQRMHLLGETVSYNDDDMSTDRWPAYCNWRTWDLRSGALLRDQPYGDLRSRPPSFDAPGLARYTGQGHDTPVPELLTDHLAQVKTRFGCANGTELLFTGLDGHGVMRGVVTDHDGRDILVDAAIPPTVEPYVMIRLDGRLVLLGVGEDYHIYRVDLDDRWGDQPDIGQPYPLPEDDPVVRLAHWNGSSDSFTSSVSMPKPPHDLEKPNGGYRSGTDSSSGLFLASGGLVVEQLTTAIGVWQLATGRWLGHVRATESTDELLRGGFAVSPDGRRIVSANPATRICVWNVDELAAEPPSRFGARRHRPDWVLGDITLPDPVTRLAFLWGGQLVAAVTESHELLVLRFRADSAILARIGLDDEVVRIIAEPHGASITCVGRSGGLSTYRFHYVPARDPATGRSDPPV
ncbi:MAG: hypothetical protein ACM3JP_00515 [Betaproteobacteria bacterium]